MSVWMLWLLWIKSHDVSSWSAFCFLSSNETLTRWKNYCMMSLSYLLSACSKPCNWNGFLLPPANEVCDGYVFTRVCLSTGGGVPGQVPPQDQVHPRAGTPPDRYPPGQVHHPGPGTPPGQVHPQAGTPPAGTPPRAGSPWTRYTSLGPGTPPWEQCMLGDMGNKRAISILLECIS